MDSNQNDKGSRFGSKGQVACKWLVGSDQTFNCRAEFCRARHLVDVNSKSAEICERVEERTASRNFGSKQISQVEARKFTFLVEDPTGHWQTRRRFMIQSGVGFVTYREGKPKKFVVGDSVKVVLSFAKHHADGERLASAVKHT